MSNKNKKLRKEAAKPSYLNHTILEFLNSNPTKIFNYKQVARELKLTDSSLRPRIIAALDYLAETEQIKKVDRGRYRAIRQRNVIEGKIFISRKGPAILTTDDGQEYEVSYANLFRAFPNDRVRAYVYPGSKRRKASVEIFEIVKRARTSFVGLVEINPNFAFFIPDSGTLPVDIFIPKSEVTRTKVKEGQKVVVEITEWAKDQHNPTGKIVKILGNIGENDTEMHAILVEFGLPYEFPTNVTEAAKKIRATITKQEIEKRRDFRNITTFTIDPADAKDFDDAISVRDLGNDVWEIGVHIADVSHYISSGDIIDKEAFVRGTSVYLVDRTVPMLPEKLSNNVCSLQPNTDKLTYSVVFNIDKNGTVLEHWIGRTIIKSQRRFTYEEVQERIETAQGDLANELIVCHNIAQKLRKKRFEKGAINFERSEVNFILDEKGRPVDVYLKENKESNQLIEELMLLANRTVATYINTEIAVRGKAKTFVYRIHDKPNQEKLERFAKFVKRFGQEINTENNRTISKSLNNLITNSNGKAWQNVVETLAIRSMARAEYSTKNIGHYGLAFEYYSHFTSPIRRYPDLMVHRLLTRYMEGKRSAVLADTESDCKHCNEREVLATSAERASIKYKQVEYLADKLEQEFDGVISGVTNWGFYVELEGNSCEGMIPLQTLEDDYYIFNEDEYCLIGEHNRRIYRLGDKVRIRVVKANLMKKQLDFELVKSYVEHKDANFESLTAILKDKKSESSGKKPKKTSYYKKSKSKTFGKKAKKR
ncbi:MAG TPA: ribonuclease R [Salinivirgaceae bacterium]|nr:ribonuclease R [Salinivirgaceae bacterium]